MKIIFWNTYKNKDINNFLIDLIIENECDILVLAEYIGDEINLINELYLKDYQMESYQGFACKKIKIFYKSDIEVDFGNDNSDYLSIKVKRNNLYFSLFAVHFPSKLYVPDDNRQMIARNLKNDIDEQENAAIVGDFNSNPFEKTMVAASCLSALPTSAYKERTVQGNKCKILYNPMWTFFDDFDKFPGTYFCRKSNDIDYFWNIYDQILLTNSLSKKLVKGSIKIIKNIGDINLIKRK